MALKVTAPLVLVTNEDGSVQYVYKDAPLPESVKGDQLARLTELGFVGEAGDESAEPAQPARKSSK